MSNFNFDPKVVLETSSRSTRSVPPTVTVAKEGETTKSAESEQKTSNETPATNISSTSADISSATMPGLATNGSKNNSDNITSITRNKQSYPILTYLNVFPEDGSERKISICDSIEEVVGPCRSLDREPLFSGKYLELSKYHFKDASGKEQTAEGVHMVKNQLNNNQSRASLTRQGSGGILSKNVGNLCTIAVLRRQIMCDSLVLVKQYRAPLQAYTIEFPATVLPNNANPRDLAAQEIEDDTGYSSSIIQHISPLTSLEPDISDGKLQIVSVTIDGDDPMQHARCDNNNQSTESNTGAHGDIVEVLKVPVNGLLERLEKYDKQGYVIDSRVYTFAIGLIRGANLVRAETIVDAESPL